MSRPRPRIPFLANLRPSATIVPDASVSFVCGFFCCCAVRAFVLDGLLSSEMFYRSVKALGDMDLLLQGSCLVVDDACYLGENPLSLLIASYQLHV